MVAPVRGDPEGIEIRADSDVRREQGKLYLPLIRCGDCHTTGWLSRMSGGQSRLSTDLDEIYNTWFSWQPEVYAFTPLLGWIGPYAMALPSGCAPNVVIYKAGLVTVRRVVR